MLSKSVNVGQTVAASFQTPTMFLIAQDLTKMQVNTDVSESDIGQVREAQVARFYVDAFPDRVFEGSVRQVRNAPRSVQNVVTYDVVIEVENGDLALRPGMTASVTLITDAKPDVLKVPLRALRFRPRTKERSNKVVKARENPSEPRNDRLWISDGEEVHGPVLIETGLRDDEYVEVVSGELSEGDEVAIGYRRRP